MTDEERSVTPSRIEAQSPHWVADERSRVLVEAIRDYAIFMLDGRGSIVSWNAGAQIMNGYGEQEVLGRHFSLLYPPEDVANGKCERELQAAAAVGRYEEEGWRVRKDHSLFWASVLITAIRDQSGHLLGFSKVVRDITEQRQLQVQLGESEERLRMLLGSIKDYAIFMLDPQGRVETWSPGAEAIKGYRAEEIVGQHISRFYTPEDVLAGKPQEVLREAEAQGQVELEGWRVRKDGTLFWADVVVSAVRDPTGKLRGFSKVTRDLTQRRRAEEQVRLGEMRFRLLVEAVKDYAIFMVDPVGQVLTWNVGAERIKGYRPEEIIGQSFHRFYPEEDVRSGKCERELEVALREGRYEEEGWRVRKDGTRFWANVTITPLWDSKGQHLGFAKVTQDLSGRRKLEDARLVAAQAQEALRLRDEFLSLASHELKTPLTALQLQLQHVRERLEALDAKTAKNVDRAVRSSERLGDLIEALMDVSRIASGHFVLNLQPFDLADAVREAADQLGEAARNAGCELSVKVNSVQGSWDRLRMEQVVTNLLSNAIRYAAGCPIEVALSRQEDTAVLEVSDEGPGIAEEALSRIFERFERAAEIRHYGGLGLGLYFVREVVRAHEGMVTVHNNPRGGVCFTVRLPLAPRASATGRHTVPGA